MNRRLLSSTLSVSALVALMSIAVTARPAHAGPIVRNRVLIATVGLQTDPDAELAAGITAYNANKFDDAITHFQNALKGRPKFADASYNLGLAYEAKKDYKSAIASLTKVIEEKPKLSDAYVERGRCYALSGAYDNAMKDFSDALTLKPNLSDAYMARADAYFQMKKYDQSAADYSKYLTLEPKPDPIIYYNLGAVNYAGQHYDASIEAFKKFVTLAAAADIADSYSFLGDAYTAKKDYAEAIPAYTKYITAHPEDKTGSALKGRALAYLQTKEYAKSIADYTQYLLLHPDDKEALNNKIVAMSASGSGGSQLIATLLDAIAKDPTNTTLRTTLAAKQIEAKDYAAAITQYNAIIAAKPDDAAALYNRGVAYGLLKDIAKAAADFAAYTKLKPTDAAGWNNLGVFLGQAKDYKGSAAAFTQYISLHPSDADFVEAYKNRGIAYYNLMDYKSALPDLQQYNTAKPGDKDVPGLIVTCLSKTGADPTEALLALVAKNPGDSDAWFNLGVAYLGKKENEKAVEAFTKSNTIKADPQTLFNRALAYSALGQAGNASAYSKAEADAASAMAMKPDYADALLVKADAEYAEKKSELASSDYNKYSTMAGVSAENKLYAQKRMLQSDIDNKNFAGVITATTGLIATNPAEPQNYLIRGTAYLSMKNFDSAIPDLVKYTGMKADDAMGFFNLGFAYNGKMDTANAAANFEKAATIKPDLYDAANQAATAYKKMADGDQADTTKATAEYDKSVGLYDKAANIASATPKQQADALYNEAAALEAKAKALDSVDPLKIAITVWGKWIVLSPTDPELAKIKQHVVDLQAKVAKES